MLDGILDQLIETKVEKISSAGGFTPESKRGQEAYARERRIYEHFEGNAHNFRLIMFLEKRENVDGLNLSDAVLLGINKYPYPGILNKKGCTCMSGNTYVPSARIGVSLMVKNVGSPAYGPVRRYRLFCA